MWKTNEIVSSERNKVLITMNDGMMEWWNDGIYGCMNKEGSITIWKERIKCIVSIKRN
jgi:hypothetical protein